MRAVEEWLQRGWEYGACDSQVHLLIGGKGIITAMLAIAEFDYGFRAKTV